jgi:hypothetical protein
MMKNFGNWKIIISDGPTLDRKGLIFTFTKMDCKIPWKEEQQALLELIFIGTNLYWN